MKINKIITELWKSDGGPVFGVVPKAMWSKWVEADEFNLIRTTNRNIIVEDGDRLILIDTGMGDKQDEKFFRHKHISERRDIESGVKEFGYKPEDVTDVIITHLHYDHIGGAVKRVDGELIPVFRNAKHWISKSQWDLAMNPNPREAASFFKDNFVPLQEHGLVHFVVEESKVTDNIAFRMFNGHTAGLIVPIIKNGDETIVFVSDFIPSSGNIPLAYVPAYDTQPLLTMKEKAEFLEEVIAGDYTLLFQHDYDTESCKVMRTERGDFRMITG